MIGVIDIAVVLGGLLLVAGIYRGLLRAKWFRKLIGGFSPPAETTEEVFESLERVHHEADETVEKTEAEIAKKAASTEKIKRARGTRHN